LRFVEAEESGEYSLTERKLFDSVSGVTSFKRQQQQGGIVKQPEVNPHRASPGNNCRTTHVEFISRGKCPAYNTKCDFWGRDLDTLK
jgi:hypothetical protein